jgi:hypothetical protein
MWCPDLTSARAVAVSATSRAEIAGCCENRTMSAASAVVARRVCAVGAVCSAAVHGLMLGSVGTPVALLVVAMIAACLYCAKDLWSVGSTRAWSLVAVMNLAMIAVHSSLPGHHHGATVGQAVPASTLMTVAVSLSLVEAAVATAVLYVKVRRSAVSSVPQWN